MQAQLQPARDRFTALDEEEQTAFRDRLGAFVNLYAFLSQIIPYADADLDRLSSFGRALLPHLRADSDGAQVHLGADVELESRVNRQSKVLAVDQLVYCPLKVCQVVLVNCVRPPMSDVVPVFVQLP